VINCLINDALLYSWPCFRYAHFTLPTRTRQNCFVLSPIQDCFVLSVSAVWNWH